MAGYPYYPQQPMINSPYGQIQPYQDRLAQLQNNYQQAMPYGQIQMQQLQPVPQSPMLQGQMVDGIDTVKAKDVDMSGNPVYYPKQTELKFTENSFNPMEGAEFLFTDS